MAKLSLVEVEHIAGLARLGLSDQEMEMFRGQLSAILEYVEVLQQLDTEGIPPTTSALPLENVTRPDQNRPSLSPEDALMNAPEKTDDYFQVQAVLGRD
jgi:aspartyl-tRNA(Asn)/glutamyl-tRNA(Gln) amidotransferase subunit C